MSKVNPNSTSKHVDSLSDIAQFLLSAQSIIITTHPNPDGDAIGSLLGALAALKQLGKSVVAFNPDPIPDKLIFLAGANEVRRSLPKQQFDIALVLDCSDARMMPNGVFPTNLARTIVVVDHHKTFGGLGDAVYCDQDAPSVGAILFELFTLMGVTITKDIGEALYCSLVSDTGSFRYQNTTAHAMHTASKLLDAGVDPWRVASQLYESRTVNELRLLTDVLATLTISSDGKTAVLTVTEEMLAKHQAGPDMVDGFINFARGIRGVEVAVLLRPQPSETRVSFRSRGAVDVSRIAAKYGGGGHRNAAGCTTGIDPLAFVQTIFADVQHEATQPLSSH